ncbi:MAG: hypothetical protein HY825_00350 [Acidobacteria bacterium]|nr:hypothetical protein [Acidobacteriota bacterium]
MRRGARSGLLSIAAALVCAFALFAGSASTALAVDAPKWVAAIYVEGQRAVGLRWIAAAGATGYKVLRSATAGSGHVEIAAPAQPQYFDNTVQPGESYFYILQAVAGAEVSPNSDEKSITIPGTKKVATVPPEWSAVKPDASTEFGKTNYRVGLAWNAPKSGKAIAYNLYRSETPGKDYQSLASSAETSYIDAKVEVGKTYYYVLTTLDDSFQESSYSPEQKVTIVEIKKEVVKKKKKVTGVPLHSKKLFTLDNNLGLLNQPRDLTVAENGTVYVADGAGHKIVVFDKDNQFVERYGEPGRAEGQLDTPSGIIIVNDDLYVTDQTNGFINIYRQDGKWVKAVQAYQDPKLKKAQPWGIAFDKNRKRFYVVDSLNSQIHVYDEDLKFEFLFGTKYDDTGKAVEPMELKYPIGVDVSNDGSRIVVVDTEAHVTFYDDKGTKLEQVGERGAGAGTFMYLNGMAHDAKTDWFFAIDKTINTAQIFDGNGNFKYMLSSEDGKGTPGLANPNGGEIVGDKLYITENLAKRYSILQLLWEKSPPPFAAAE